MRSSRRRDPQEGCIDFFISFNWLLVIFAGRNTFLDFTSPQVFGLCKYILYLNGIVILGNNRIFRNLSISGLKRSHCFGKCSY